jgi:hypothetical protein
LNLTRLEVVDLQTKPRNLQSVFVGFPVLPESPVEVMMSNSAWGVYVLNQGAYGAVDMLCKPHMMGSVMSTGTQVFKMLPPSHGCKLHILDSSNVSAKTCCSGDMWSARDPGVVALMGQLCECCSVGKYSATRAEPSADEMTFKDGPWFSGMAHLLHMPGHTYLRYYFYNHICTRVLKHGLLFHLISLILLDRCGDYVEPLLA